MHVTDFLLNLFESTTRHFNQFDILCGPPSLEAPALKELSVLWTPSWKVRV